MQSNNNDFKMAGKKGKKVRSIVPEPNKPVITCDHCKKLWHTKDKCFQFIKEQDQIEKLKTTECNYCHALGHNNLDCPVSKANTEKKAQKQKQKEAKFEADFPQALLSEPKQKDNTNVSLKFAWASVAMANRDPIKVQKIEREDAVLKKAIKLVEKEQAEQARERKKQAKLAMAKEKWLKIGPVINALKNAFPRTWIYKVENTQYDIKAAVVLRDEEDRKREDEEAKQEQFYWESEQRHYEEVRKKEAQRALMSPEELEEDYRQTDEDCEDAAMNKQNRLFCRMFREQCRSKISCVSCFNWLEDDNQGTRCVDCIFQLGFNPMKI